MKLSEKLKRYRIDRPDEWTMDEFARQAKELEDSIERISTYSKNCEENAAIADIINEELCRHT